MLAAWPLSEMKWGFASTAALVLAQQKDSFHANQLSEEVKTVALDWLDVRTFLKWEEWIEAAGRLAYWLLLTGSGNCSMGEEYVRMVPVDLKSRKLLLQRPSKRIIFALLSTLLPLVLNQETSEMVEAVNSVQFYWNGKFPTLLHRLFSIRYIFHPRKPPIMDADKSFYQFMAILLASLKAQKTLTRLKHQRQSNQSSLDPKAPKCPVCFDPVSSPVASGLCGHVCCWTCVQRWRQRESNCPVCRVSVPETEIIPVINL